MIEVNTLTPIEDPPPEALKENAFLYRAEVKPLAEAPEPSDDEVQEIAVEAGTDSEIGLIFNAKDPDLGDRVAGVCNSYYVNSGMAGIQALIRAITETGFRGLAGMPAPAPNKDVPEVKGEQTYSSPDYSPRREALRMAVADLAGNAVDRRRP